MCINAEMTKEKDVARISLYVPTWVKVAIKQEIAPTGQTQNEWILDQIIEQLQQLGYRPPIKYTSLADLVEENLDWLTAQTELSRDVLNSIQQGYKADQITLLRLALAMEMSEAEIKALNDKQPQSDKHNTSS
jgi:hypothetical protein